MGPFLIDSAWSRRERADHPFRATQKMTDRMVATLSPRVTKMYAARF
jgi:hypothetical protein